MKKGLSLVVLLVVLGLLVVGSTTGISGQLVEKAKPEMIIGLDYDEDGGADAYANAGDNVNSRYYVNLDFYNMTSDDQLTIIPRFKTMQQTTEWSCGNVTALMVLHHFGNTAYTEMEIAEIMGSSTDLDTPGAKPGSANNFYEYGTNVKQMVEFFQDLDGFEVLETSYWAEYTTDDLITLEDGFTPSDVGNLWPAFSSNVLTQVKTMMIVKLGLMMQGIVIL